MMHSKRMDDLMSEGYVRMALVDNVNKINIEIENLSKSDLFITER